MIVVGVDPSIAACGIAAVDRAPRKILHLETVRSDTDSTDAARFQHIYARICTVLRATRARAIVVEEQRRVQAGAHGRGEFNANNSKTMVVFGLACAAAWAHGFPVFVVTPQQAKNAVLGKGNGNAKKPQVKAAVLRMLGPDAGRFSADAADAVAIACAVSMFELARACQPST